MRRWRRRERATTSEFKVYTVSARSRPSISTGCSFLQVFFFSFSIGSSISRFYSLPRDEGCLFRCALYNLRERKGISFAQKITIVIRINRACKKKKLSYKPFFFFRHTAIFGVFYFQGSRECTSLYKRIIVEEKLCDDLPTCCAWWLVFHTDTSIYTHIGARERERDWQTLYRAQ